ncbi:MAG TPA: DUF4235 domain-containing protein [Kribbella sp.]|nr:DUF4235 domain-containing protein [Kribbella sp.]
MAGVKIGWKLVLAVFTAFTLAVSLVTKKAVTSAWKPGSGGKPLKGHQAGLVEVISWAVASGIAAGVAKHYAEERATQYWLKSTGNPPPGHEEPPA